MCDITSGCHIAENDGYLVVSSNQTLNGIVNGPVLALDYKFIVGTVSCDAACFRGRALNVMLERLDLRWAVRPEGEDSHWSEW